MADKYSDPYKVLERGNKAWKIQVGERVDVVCRDRLKPHLGSVAPKAPCSLGTGGQGRPLWFLWLLLLWQGSQGGLCSRARVKITGRVCIVQFNSNKLYWVIITVSTLLQITIMCPL